MKALYWGLGTLMSAESQMDVVPQTGVERLFVTVVIVVGTVMGAMVIGELTILLGRRAEEVKRYQSRIREVDELFRLYSVPKELKKRIRQYTEYEFDVSRGFDFELVVNRLPPQMQQELKVELLSPLIRKSNCFVNGEPELIAATCMHLRSQVALAGETIMRQGEYADSWVILKAGKVEVVRSDQGVEIRFAIMDKSGASFGEVGLITGERRSASIRAITPIHFFSMEAEVCAYIITTPHSYQFDHCCPKCEATRFPRDRARPRRPGQSGSPRRGRSSCPSGPAR